MALQRGGSKHTPDAIKAVMGRKDQVKKPKIKAQTFVGYFDPPSHVKEQPHAEAVWKITLPMLQDMGVITAADLDALCTYCVAVGMHRQASLALSAKGHLTFMSVTEKGGTIERKYPEHDIISTQAKIIQSFAGEFGLTPSSRARLNVTIPAENDPLAEFMSN